MAGPVKRRWWRGGLWAGVVVLAGWWLPPAALGQTKLPADLQALIAEALEANPELKQMAGVRTAAQQATRAAGALEDPMIGFTLKDLPVHNWSFNEDDMTQKMFEVSQKLPFPGKRRLRTEVAEHQAKADDLSYQDKANEIRARVVQNYWGLALAFASYDIAQKNKQFWEQVVQVTETRYGAGMGMQADVLQAQVELGSYLDRLLQWQQARESLTAELNALRAKPAEAPVPRPQPLRPANYTVKMGELLQLAEGRPLLMALKALIVKQQKAVDLARKDYYPDVTVGLGYGLRQNYYDKKRSDMFTAGVSINVPLWFESKLRPKVEEEEAKRGAVREAYNSAWSQLEAALKDRVAKLTRLDQQIKLYDRGIIPQAQQAAQAALASYQVGALEFSRVYQNQIAAYEAELKLQEYLKEAEENWAALEWLVGQELPRRPGGKR